MSTGSVITTPGSPSSVSNLGQPLDDTQLLTLAVNPPQPLLPALRYSGMTPLVTLLAIFGPLGAAWQAPLDEISAAWGLLSVEVLSASGAKAMLLLQEGAFPGQPPLCIWLTAIVLHLTRDWPFSGLLAVSCLGTAGIVSAAFAIGRHLGGVRLGLIAAISVGCHPWILVLAQRPTFHAAGVSLGLLAIWGALSHRRRSGGFFSGSLCGAGVALGFCLLAAGPLALLIWLIIALEYLTDLPPRRVSPAGAGRGMRQPARIFWQRIGALGLLAGIMLLLGGWWPMLRLSHEGANFLAEWSNFLPLGAAVADGASPQILDGAIGFPLTMWLLGLAAFGAWDCAVRTKLRPEDQGAGSQRLMLWWAGLAILLWGLAELPGFCPAEQRPLWRAMAAVPVMLLAAIGVLGVSDRRWPLRDVLIAGGVTLVTVALGLREPLLQLGGLVFVIALAAGLAVLIWRLYKLAVRQDLRQRWTMQALLAMMVFGSAILGLTRVARTGPDDVELLVFREKLARIPQIRQVTFISSIDAPRAIEFAIRDVWPRARYQQAATWEAALELPNAIQPDATHICISWAAPDLLRSAAPAETIQISPVTSPRLYRGKELTAYRLGGPLP